MVAYSPFNESVFDAAFAGALAGMQAPGTNITAASYFGLAQLATSFAQTFDSEWHTNGANTPPTILQTQAIQSECEAAFLGRAGLPTATWATPGAFTVSCDAIIATVNEGTAYLGSIGYASPPVSAVPIGTPNAQLGTTKTFEVFGSTINAAALVVDTGYAPIANHMAKLTLSSSVVDRTAHTVATIDVESGISHFGGTVALPGTLSQSTTTPSDDATLSTSAVTVSVVAGTLNVTFTPPGGYVGNLDWLTKLTIEEN